MKLAFLLVIAAFTLAAQFGQPPGGYPGRYPGGGSPNGSPGSGRSRKTTRQEQPAGHTEVVSGVVRKVDADSFELEAEDTRFLIIQFSADSKSVRVGDGLDVTANMDADGMFHVVSMMPNKTIAETINENDSIGPEFQPQEPRTGPPPTILVRPDATPDPGDSGPPVLKRGKPAERASTPIPADSDADTSASRPSLSRTNPPVPRGNAHMVLIEQAREAAANFLEGLPNYVCQEQTTRYVSETRTPSWNVVDVVSAEVVYDDHQESYRNLQINGRPTKKSPEDSGAWSTGEFGTILGNLFAPQSATEFKYIQEDTIAHRPASVFDFKVLRVRSSWKIWVPGQYVVPQYKGSVWIDNKTAQVLRIEMQAKEIPEAFPEISVETAVDYDTINLGAADKFLLPVHAEALSCWRNSNECQRNAIEFRNYHKFEGESVIKFEQQEQK
ncbi:MAG: hypothetical protein ACLPWF_04925 [Bryobacteraceae bacterium]